MQLEKLLKSIQLKRKVSFGLVGAGIVGALYLMYYKGKTDEVNELCNIVKEHGSIPITYKLKTGDMTIGMHEITS